MYQLTIKDPNSLLSTVTKQDINDAQVNNVLAVLRATDLTYGELLAFLAGRHLGKIAIEYGSENTDPLTPWDNPVINDAPLGAGYDVEAERG
jgi:hypothetical protein